MLSGLVQGLGMLIEPVVTQSSRQGEPGLLELLVWCLKVSRTGGYDFGSFLLYLLYSFSLVFISIPKLQLDSLDMPS